VNDQGVDGVALPDGLEALDLDWVRRAGAPHPGARREDLKGLGADFSRAQRRLFEGTEGVEVDAEAQMFILSAWRGASPPDSPLTVR